MKRILCLVLILSFVFGMTGCSNKKGEDKPSSNTSSGFTSSTEKDYEDTVSQWESEDESNGEFDNTQSSLSSQEPYESGVLA